MKHLAFLLLLLVAEVSLAEEEGQPFDVSELPRGSVLTLPHEMPMLAPTQLHLQLHASERRQLVKLSAKSVGGAPVLSYKVAVYDRLASKVRYLHLKPGVAAVYKFKGFSPVRFVPLREAHASGLWAQQRILLESLQPLGVSHENGENRDRGLSEN